VLYPNTKVGIRNIPDTVLAGITGSAGLAGIAFVTFRAGLAGIAFVTFRAGLAGIAFVTFRAGSAGIAFVAFRAGNTVLTVFNGVGVAVAQSEGEAVRGGVTLVITAPPEIAD
jgi:hypothetical protein